MARQNRSDSPHTRLAGPARARRSGQASARVYQVLREQILAGALAPGTHLSQQGVAASLGTSNGPVITALRQLAHEGLVVHEAGRGCHVRQWGEAQVEDLMTVRRAVETEAARLASRRAGPEDLEHLRAVVERMAAAVRGDRPDEADAADAELHEAVARLSRSPGLAEVLSRCHVRELVRRRRGAVTAAHLRRQVAEHRALVEAIASGDPDRAGRAMYDHLARGPFTAGPRGGAPRP
jgi:GntR family transcriptional regulator, rspAB operon transcriptional repressor